MRRTSLITVLAVLLGSWSIGTSQDVTGPTITVTLELDGPMEAIKEEWLPEGNVKDENEWGNYLAFKMFWKDDNPNTSAAPRKFIVKLSDVSAWPGVCGNRGTNTKKDVRILPGEVNKEWVISEDGQQATTKDEYKEAAPAYISLGMFDFAAKGTVKASVETKSGDGAVGDSGPNSFPPDRDGDGLPNYFERLNAGVLDWTNPDTDADGTGDDREDDDAAPPGAPHAGPPMPPGGRTFLGLKGDGLTNWEEYRGFAVKKTEKVPEHKRLDITRKEFFVFSEFKHIGYLANHPAKPYELIEGDFGPKMQINRNNFIGGVGVHGATLQRGLFVKKMVEGPDGVGGITFIPGTAAGKVKVVTTGNDGICNSDVALDEGGNPRDVQLIEKGKGAAYAVAIRPGTDKILQSTPAGDDEIAFGTINTGKDGIRQTPKAGDDDEVIPAVGMGAPNAVAIIPGTDEVLHSGNAGDDTIVDEQFVPSLTPNEVDRIEIYTATIDKAAKEKKVSPMNLLKQTIAHEGGHGTHIEHYDPSQTNDPYVQTKLQQKELTVMRIGAEQGRVPSSYDADEAAQVRLHLKHE